MNKKKEYSKLVRRDFILSAPVPWESSIFSSLGFFSPRRPSVDDNLSLSAASVYSEDNASIYSAPDHQHLKPIQGVSETIQFGVDGDGLYCKYDTVRLTVGLLHCPVPPGAPGIVTGTLA